MAALSYKIKSSILNTTHGTTMFIIWPEYSAIVFNGQNNNCFLQSMGQRDIFQAQGNISLYKNAMPYIPL